MGENYVNVTAQAGSTAYLNCKITLLQDKTVRIHNINPYHF